MSELRHITQEKRKRDKSDDVEIKIRNRLNRTTLGVESSLAGCSEPQNMIRHLVHSFSFQYFALLLILYYWLQWAFSAERCHRASHENATIIIFELILFAMSLLLMLWQEEGSFQLVLAAGFQNAKLLFIGHKKTIPRRTYCRDKTPSDFPLWNNYFYSIDGKFTFCKFLWKYLELGEALLCSGSLCNFQYVETYCLRDGAAFTDGCDVSDLDVSAIWKRKRAFRIWSITEIAMFFS